MSLVTIILEMGDCGTAAKGVNNFVQLLVQIGKLTSSSMVA